MFRKLESTALQGHRAIGKINIDNRIFSKKAELTILAGNKCRFVQFDAELPDTSVQVGDFFAKYNQLAALLNNWDKIKKVGTVEVMIDGRSYSGSEIIIDGYYETNNNYKVYVDGNLANENKATNQPT